MYYDFAQILVIIFFVYVGIVTASAILINKYHPAILEKRAAVFAMLLIAPMSVIYQILTLIGSILIAIILIFVEVNDNNVFILILGSFFAFAVDNAIYYSINTSQAATYKKKRRKYVPEFMLAFAALMLFEGAFTDLGLTALIFILSTFFEYFISKEEFKPFNEVLRFILELKDAAKRKDSQKRVILLKPFITKVLRIVGIAVAIYLTSIIETSIIICLVIVSIYIAIAVTYYKGIKKMK